MLTHTHTYTHTYTHTHPCPAASNVCTAMPASAIFVNTAQHPGKEKITPLLNVYQRLHLD